MPSIKCCFLVPRVFIMSSALPPWNIRSFCETIADLQRRNNGLTTESLPVSFLQLSEFSSLSYIPTQASQISHENHSQCACVGLGVGWCRIFFITLRLETDDAASWGLVSHRLEGCATVWYSLYQGLVLLVPRRGTTRKMQRNSR